MSYWGYAPYVSVAQKRARAEKKLKQLKKKMPDIRPVVLQGNRFARTWWAKSWNKNLERYADFANRIERGRSYLGYGAVLDLKMAPGRVKALVLGSAPEPYEVAVEIKPIGRRRLQAIEKECRDHLKSLQELLAGKFSESLAGLFFAEKTGLFPTPKEISFECSCPDWASMCKHVAAVLFGIGARFDEDPALFFTLRGVAMEDLVAGAVKDRTEDLLKKTKRQRGKVIADDDLAELFGIDLDSRPEFGVGKSTSEVTKNSPTKTATGQVAALIAAASAGITIAELAEKTGYPKTRLYGIVHQLKRKGIVKNLARGVYTKA